MSRILIVDDSEIDRRVAAGLLERELEDVQLEFAANGRDAVTRLRDQTPDLVLTDMQMPERDGLELVKAIRLHYPQVPVILMTAHGSDHLAIQALEEGAAGYVAKSQLAEKLCETVEEVLAIARADRTYERLIGCLAHTQLSFQLDNDAALIDPLIDLVQQMAAGMRLCDVNDRFRVGVALKSALLNALYRGNLEISFEQMQAAREELMQGKVLDLVEQRRQATPYSDRRIHVYVDIRPEEGRFVVRDEGPGFDVAALQSATATATLDPSTGRGLVLIRAFMDEVRFNEQGNEVTLIKRRTANG